MDISIAVSYNERNAALRRHETTDTPEYSSYHCNMWHEKAQYNRKPEKMPESFLLCTSPKSQENIVDKVLTFEQYMKEERESATLNAKPKPEFTFDFEFFVLIQSAMLRRESN